jgi:glycosyltransferase involved in cell wall biosynthesis
MMHPLMHELAAQRLLQRGIAPETTRMSVRPKLLFLSQTLPFPPDAGVKVRTFNVLRALSRTFDITALCFYRWKPGLLQQDLSAGVEALSEYGATEAFPIPHEHNRVRLIWDHCRSLCSGKVYTLFTYESSSFRRRLSEVLAREMFDLVHADSLDLASYFPLCGNTPIVCTHHDVQSVLLHRRSRAEQLLPRRRYLALQARFTEAEERRWCPRVAANVTVSHTDAETLRRVAPGMIVHVVPNGVDTEFFQPVEGNGGGIVFVGGTSWFPNRDALQYFCEEVLPLLRARGVDTPVTVVGRARDTEKAEFTRKYGVTLTGYVPDIRPYLASADCFIAPLRVGGGTRIKILDAWAMGKAVVSTTIGCEGLAAVDSENILVRDTPADFAGAVYSILTEPGLGRDLGRAARKTAEEMYSWNTIGTQMADMYLALLRGVTPGHSYRTVVHSSTPQRAATEK